MSPSASLGRDAHESRLARRELSAHRKEDVLYFSKTAQRPDWLKTKVRANCQSPTGRTLPYWSATRSRRGLRAASLDDRAEDARRNVQDEPAEGIRRHPLVPVELDRYLLSEETNDDTFTAYGRVLTIAKRTSTAFRGSLGPMRSGGPAIRGATHGRSRSHRGGSSSSGAIAAIEDDRRIARVGSRLLARGRAVGRVATDGPRARSAHEACPRTSCGCDQAPARCTSGDRAGLVRRPLSCHRRNQHALLCAGRGDGESGL